jgi:hypothetical protein
MTTVNDLLDRTGESAMNIDRYTTREQINLRIAQCVKRRDYSADVLGKVLLAMTYQQEIDALVDKPDTLPTQLTAECPACGIGLNIHVPPPVDGGKIEASNGQE